MSNTPAPVIDDPDTGGFWKAAQNGRLALQFCLACQHVVHLPLPRCPRCGNAEMGWKDVAAQGRVYSWTTVTHQVHPAFPVPYTVILIELTDHPQARLVGHLPGQPRLFVGQLVRAEFPRDVSGVVVPQWMPTEPAPA